MDESGGLMVGAGNIELLVDPVKQILDKKE